MSLCSQAIIKVLNNVLPAINEKKISLVTMIDLSKAFDCVCHKLLIAKLERYGVRKEALAFLRSCLSLRTQRVKIKSGNGNEVFTDFMEIDGGVPQGSVLVPFLYIVNANDLNNIMDGINMVTFADDICITVTGTDFPILVDIMNRGLITLSNWSRFNLLPINYSKCHALIVTNRKVQDPDTLRIDSHTR